MSTLVRFEAFSTLILLAVFAGSAISSAQAQDLAREKRMADEIVDAILDGDPVNLAANGHEFLSIYTETGSGKPKGTVVLIHGRGFHPDWPEVVGPLRVGLAESGWHTLSVQMPVLEKDAKYYDYVPLFPAVYPRLDATLAYVREQGSGPVVLLAHSCGVHMSMAYLEARQFKGIDAYIGVGMGATDYKQPMNRPFPLNRLKMPVLDVWGSDDYPAVHRLAPRRAANIAKTGVGMSKQVVVPEADHYFRDQDEALLEVVNGWLAEIF